MDSQHLLLISGIVLLSMSALLGFAQERHRHRPDAFALWRVVHVGGTAGAVQLLALSAVWPTLSTQGWFVPPVAAGIVFSTCAFFVGPLGRALGRDKFARVVNWMGALVALPTYLVLPFLFL